jgi:hypothetical protein
MFREVVYRSYDNRSGYSFSPAYFQFTPALIPFLFFVQRLVRRIEYTELEP